MWVRIQSCLLDQAGCNEEKSRQHYLETKIMDQMEAGRNGKKRKDEAEFLNERDAGKLSVKSKQDAEKQQCVAPVGDALVHPEDRKQKRGVVVMEKRMRGNSDVFAKQAMESRVLEGG